MKMLDKICIGAMITAKPWLKVNENYKAINVAAQEKDPSSVLNYYRRLALEILNLEERTLKELNRKEDVVEGTITIGCGEFAAVETLAKICKTYKEKYPLVQIVLHTATADTVYEMMNKGLVDIALFMEPVDTEGLDYIRISDCDHWCVGMRPDDPLAEKEFIKKEDLIGKPLILPERTNVQSELANWFGKDFSKLQIAFTSNLGTNAGVMAANGLGYPVSIEGAAKYWREDILVQRRNLELNIMTRK